MRPDEFYDTVDNIPFVAEAARESFRAFDSALGGLRIKHIESKELEKDGSRPHYILLNIGVELSKGDPVGGTMGLTHLQGTTPDIAFAEIQRFIHEQCVVEGKRLVVDQFGADPRAYRVAGEPGNLVFRRETAPVAAATAAPTVR